MLLVGLLAVGLGLLGYSVAAASSVRQVTDDRTAVLAGAHATGEVEVSWLLDPGAARLPPATDDDGGFDPTIVSGPAGFQPVAGVRVPPLPGGTTIVWRARTTVPPEYGNLDLLVVDPDRFAQAAAWGTGPEWPPPARCCRAWPAPTTTSPPAGCAAPPRRCRSSASATCCSGRATPPPSRPRRAT
ncbi:hypothetical protein GCM10025868_11080 [Angustibacter aerolatus]|uniref:SAF domain-containing protein n=1 Tax=Angustibacter aerolatus TaxID=1162965 RepID=A0ABQ6JCH1_9ACTN|nr:hypothetical protein GCM10025868_11080 [Angustibacter aerolatus]